MNKFQECLQEFDDKIAAIREQKKAMIIEQINECKHPEGSVVTLPYKRQWSSSDAPWLLCEDCGYTEEGWGGGFNKLEHVDEERAGKIDFDEWINLRTYCVWQYQREPMVCV